MNIPTKIYTPEELSELLHLHYQTILAEIHRGNLPAYKLKGKYRVSEEQLLEYLNKNYAN
jgi:excisionase family DNA binding protein